MKLHQLNPLSHIVKPLEGNPVETKRQTTSNPDAFARGGTATLPKAETGPLVHNAALSQELTARRATSLVNANPTQAKLQQAKMSPQWEYLWNNRDVMNGISRGWGKLPNMKFWKSGEAPARTRSRSVDDFVKMALSQEGKTYALGAEVRSSNKAPKEFDCSELVEWAAARVGVRVPDGSMNQKRASKRISVSEALKTKGALLFKEDPRHVAISLGDGRTIEARWPWGVDIASGWGRGFTSGGLIKGMKYD